MPRLMQYVAHLSPMYYSNKALREIIIKGTPLSRVFSHAIILALFAIVTIVAEILVSKKRI